MFYTRECSTWRMFCKWDFLQKKIFVTSKMFYFMVPPKMRREFQFTSCARLGKNNRSHKMSTGFFSLGTVQSFQSIYLIWTISRTILPYTMVRYMLHIIIMDWKLWTVQSEKNPVNILWDLSFFPKQANVLHWDSNLGIIS